MVALTLMTADGAVLECSESSNADVFQAARVHLGCLGVILTVTLQCVPQFHLQETSFPSTLKEVFVFVSPFPSLRKKNRSPDNESQPSDSSHELLRGQGSGAWILSHQIFLGPRETVVRTLVGYKTQKHLRAY